MILKMHVLFLPLAISTFSYAFSNFFYLAIKLFLLLAVVLQKIDHNAN